MKISEKRSVIAGLYGNALEWYDFLLYASFAPLFAKLFFTTEHSFISLIATFGVFAVGFLIRPVGGALLGYIADHAGRRTALILSVTIMSVSTGLIALLPEYETAGIWSPILFTLLRLIQGVAVGGELPGSVTFLIEHMFANRRGFAGSLVLSSVFLGILFGSMVSSILSIVFSYDYLYHWGWRYAYLLGGLLGVYGIVLRVKSTESPAFLTKEEVVKTPIRLVLVEYRKPLVLAALFTSIMAMGNYLLVAYATTFLVQTKMFAFRDAISANFLSLFLLTILIPIMGIVSDRVGRKPVFFSGVFALLLLIFPIFALLDSGHWGYVLIAELLLSFILAPLNATVPTIIAEMFPTGIRASGSSIGYNIGQALFGGTLPLIALSLSTMLGSIYAPAWYIWIWAFIILATTSSFEESYQNKFA